MGDAESGQPHCCGVSHLQKNTGSEEFVRDAFRVYSPLCMEQKGELPSKHPASWKENTYLVSIMDERVCLGMEKKTLEIMEITLWLWSPSHAWLLTLTKSTATMPLSHLRTLGWWPQENGAPPAPCWPGGWQQLQWTSWPQGQWFLSTPCAGPGLQGVALGTCNTF